LLRDQVLAVLLKNWKKTMETPTKNIPSLFTEKSCDKIFPSIMFYGNCEGIKQNKLFYQ